MFAITETKPKNGDIPPKESLELNGFDLFISNHYNDPDTRGVVMYAKNSLNASLVKIDECQNFKDCLWIRIPTQENDLLVGCIYRSGTQNKAVTLDPEMYNMIKSMTLKCGYKNVLIVGDFNHPGIKWSPHPIITTDHRNQNHPEYQFVNCITDAMLTQHVSKATRDREGQRSVTDDLIFTSDEDMIENLQHIGHCGASDHQILMFTTVNTFKNTKCNKSLTRFKYHQADLINIEANLSKDWDEIFKDKDIEECYEIFMKEYNDACETHIPKEVLKKTDAIQKPMWMKPATLRLIKRKKSRHIKFLNTRSRTDREEYNRIRNEVTAATRSDRISFERNISKEIKNNNKLFWRYVNSQRKSKASIPDLKRKDGTYATTDADKAEILNSQFSSVFTREDLTNIPTFEPVECHTLLETLTTTPAKVEKNLKKLRTDKSCGPDKVHPFLLNKLAKCMSIVISKLFNISLQTGKLPTIWKEGIVTALFKKGSRSLASNYRGITLTSVICKQLEKIIVEALENHLRSNNLQDKNQHGFTKKKSPITNLLEALNIWSEAISHGLPVDVIYLDFEKAFDKVPHQRLLLQLEKYGIRGQVLSWIRDYLHNRQQKVRVNGVMSASSPVLSGVPQGSVLGPALFLIFVADVKPLIQNFLSLYADDSKLFTYMQDSQEHQHSIASIQQDINILSSWSEKMQMSYNEDKCHTLHMGANNEQHTYTLPKVSDMKKSNNGISYTYTFHNLKNVPEEKDLGVIVDEKLNFKAHISSKIAKANSTIYLIKNCFKYLDAPMFKMLYKSLIRPHLEYATPIWSPITKSEKIRIEGVQRRATKLVPELSNLPYKERLQHLKLPSLEYRRTRADILLLYNYINNNVIINTDTRCKICRTSTNMLSPITSGTRGHPFRFKILRHPNIRNRFFTTRTLPIWNNLKEETVMASTLNGFKNKLSVDPSMPSQYIIPAYASITSTSA